MFKKIVCGLLTCLISTAVFMSNTPALAGPTSKVTMAWHYPALAPLSEAQNMDIMSANWFYMGVDLSIDDQGDDYSLQSVYHSYNYVKTAHARGMKVVPRLEGPNNEGWPAEDILKDPAKRQTIINNVNSLIEKYKANGADLDGINLDFEAIGKNTMPYYTQFVKELAAAVKAKGLTFSVDVPGKTSYTSEDSTWTAGYDFTALGQIPEVDYVVIMAYDWKYGAPKNYVRDALTYATQRIAKSKLLLGIPLYSMDYDSSERLISKPYYSNSIAMINAPGANPQVVWDDTLGMKKVTYTNFSQDTSGSTHVLYLEDSDSLRVKLDLMNEFGIAGMSAWSYYNVDKGIWQVIGEKTGKVSPILNSTGLWSYRFDGSNFTPNLAWYSTPFGLPWKNVKAAEGDFTGDGKADVAVMYNYGNSTVGMWVISPDGEKYTTKAFWQSGKGSFSWENSKLVSGDFNGDGKTDLGVFYNYGGNTSGLWTFLSDGSKFTPKLAWQSKPGNFSWLNSKLAAGDFDGTGKANLAVLYDYGNNTTGIWNFVSNGASLQPSLAWQSKPGNFSWNASKLTSGDYNGDGKRDLAVVYDYGSSTTGIWNFQSNGGTFTPKIAWQSARGNFAWDKVQVESGDFSADGLSDITMLYDYGNNTSGLFYFNSNGVGFVPKLSWQSGRGGFAWSKSILLAGDSNGDKRAEAQVIYDFAQ